MEFYTGEGHNQIYVLSDQSSGSEETLRSNCSSSGPLLVVLDPFLQLGNFQHLRFSLPSPPWGLPLTALWTSRFLGKRTRFRENDSDT